jgi:Cyclin, N-terminal domain
MNFAQSTQARHWMFSEASLAACRQRSLQCSSGVATQCFASGFHQRYGSCEDDVILQPAAVVVPCDSEGDDKRVTSSPTPILWQRPPENDLSIPDYDISHQNHQWIEFYVNHLLSRIVGPHSWWCSLRSSSATFRTAITLLSRFYLSNSMSHFHPQLMTVCAAFLASKVEDEPIKVRCHGRALERLLFEYCGLARFPQSFCGDDFRSNEQNGH